MTMVVLISGRGSNLRAILDSSVDGSVVAVISDNPDAAGLQIAAQHGKPAHIVNTADTAAFEKQLQTVIDSHNPTLIALAGFFRILSADFIRHYGDRRIVNIHPSLLPAFPGLNTHQRALDAKVREHGCTVHWVNAAVDGGDIIAQQRVPVRDGDDADALAARVLAAEHILYPQTLRRLLRDAA